MENGNRNFVFIFTFVRHALLDKVVPNGANHLSESQFRSDIDYHTGFNKGSAALAAASVASKKSNRLITNNIVL